jgi:phosphotriesterase-related protein
MQVQTVTGAIPLERLGRTLMHEHLLIRYPGAELDPTIPFDRAAFVGLAVERLKSLKEHGVSTFVDPCPIDFGRDVPLMAEIAEKARMQVVCTTGFYYDAFHGIPNYWRTRSAQEIAELYISEIEKGIGATRIRAGAIKCASYTPPPSEVDDKLLEAASLAQKATGVPIITHTQDGVFGPEQQEILLGHGTPAHCCLIGHCCGNADPEYHRRIVERGSYIGFDRVGMVEYQPDEVRADNVVRLVRAGHGARVILSQDRPCYVHGKSAPGTPMARLYEKQRELGGWPRLPTHLFTKFLPMLRERGLADAEIFSLLDDNPRRLFAGSVA